MAAVTILGEIDIGDEVRFSMVFKDANDVDADPDTVTFRTRQSDGTEVSVISQTPPVIKDATGRYHADIVMTQSGRFHWRWVGVGTINVVEEDFIPVKKTAFDIP